MRRFVLFLCLALAAANCTQPAATRPATSAGAAKPPIDQTVLLDFEKPEIPVTWVPAASAATAPATSPSTSPDATAPSSQPDQPQPQRSSLKPQAGLWSLLLPVSAPGALRYAPPHPLNLGEYDLLTVQVADEDAPARNGTCTAAVRLTDADGHTCTSDGFPVLSSWQPVTCDLQVALNNGLDLSRIASIELLLQPATDGSPPASSLSPPLRVKTDTWAVRKEQHSYLGSSLGMPHSFFVETRGTRIHVGSVDQYDLFVTDQGLAPSSQPWLQIVATPPQSASPAGPGLPREVIGQPYTGLYLLDQDALSAMPARRTTPDDAAPDSLPDVPPPSPAAASGMTDRWSWPASIAHAGATIQWHVAWATPVAAIIEGHQEAGGFDALGEPMLTATWRLMIYQWGQVFVHVQWTQTGQSDTPLALPRPVSWALLSMPRPNQSVAPPSQNAPADADNAQRLLTEIYPATFRQGLATALPHRMQTGAAVAMIAPASPQKDNFWWSHAAGAGGSVGGVGMPTRWAFGAGIPSPVAATTGGEATCMLLVNSPNALAMAGAFGQYLAPPKIIVQQGELDRNFPGDMFNDGFVEGYGFQVVRLAGGRATFTIYPQERPIFYPPILFTVPAAERDALDVKHSRLLINIDGKQFANPPQFPDGSFLLQIPYTLDRPVNVEALLVHQ